MPAADRWIEIDMHNRIHVTSQDVGSDVTLVLWCGLGSTGQSFLHFLREGQERGVNVLAIDPPGHGLSPVWASDLTVVDTDQIWLAVLRASPCIDSRQVWVGGHSYGAYTALMALPVIRDHITGLVLLDGGYLDPFPEYNREEVFQGNSEYLSTQRFDSWDAYLAREKTAAGHWDADAEAILRSNMRESDEGIVPVTGLDGAMQACDVLSAYRVTDVVDCALPALLLRATEPPELDAIRDAGVAALQANLHELEVVLVQSGHDLPIDNPAAMTETVWSFLDRRR